MLYMIAIGGNAVSSRSTLRNVALGIVDLFQKGNEIIVTHGNGPQVGRLALRDKKSLALLTEETEREIGSEIVDAISKAAKGDKRVLAKIVLTHVLVDRNDREFRSPSKPIGRFYSESEAARMRKKGFVMKRMLKGYRRVVPSPRPKAIVEERLIRELPEFGIIVVAAGGGGIPVTKSRRLENAVIDKDLASSLLAMRLKADELVILTNTAGVYLNFGTKHQTYLEKVESRPCQDMQNRASLRREACYPR